MFFFIPLALHQIIPSNDLNVILASHCPKSCLVCVSENPVNGDVHEKEISIFDQVQHFIAFFCILINIKTKLNFKIPPKFI